MKKLELYEQRMEDALQTMMMENYKRIIRYLAHSLVVVLLYLIYLMLQQPNFVFAVQFVVVFVHHLGCWWVARSHLTFATLRLLMVLSHAGHTFLVVITHSSEEADYNFLSVFAALRVSGAALIHDPPVCIPCQAWVFVVEVACYFGLDGTRRGPPWHFLCSQAVILAMVCGVAVMVQDWARTCSKASFQSADANLSLEGFQRVLRGVCDADVLLDDSFHIVGDNTRLRRVLATPTDTRRKVYRPARPGGKNAVREIRPQVWQHKPKPRREGGTGERLQHSAVPARLTAKCVFAGWCGHLPRSFAPFSGCCRTPSPSGIYGGSRYETAAGSDSWSDPRSTLHVPRRRQRLHVHGCRVGSRLLKTQSEQLDAVQGTSRSRTPRSYIARGCQHGPARRAASTRQVQAGQEPAQSYSLVHAMLADHAQTIGLAQHPHARRKVCVRTVPGWVSRDT